MRKESGFTLVEVLIAIVIMGIVVVGAALMPRAIKNLRLKTECRTAAMSIAESVIEQQRDKGFANVEPISETPVNDATLSTTAKNYNVTYTYATSVAYFTTNNMLGTNLNSMLTSASSSSATIKQVKVVVKWTGDSSGSVTSSALIQ